MTTLSKRTSYFLVFVLLCCCGTAQAQDQLKLRMSLSYQGAAAPQVFEALASVLGCRLQLDKRVTGSVTLDVRNVTAETVLRAVCESVGCRWRIDKGQLVVDHDPDATSKAQADSYVRGQGQRRPPGDPGADTLERRAAGCRCQDSRQDARRGTLAGPEPLRQAHFPESESGHGVGRAQRPLSASCLPVANGERTEAPPCRAPGLGGSAFESDLAPGVAHVGEPGVTAPKLVHRAGPRYPKPPSRRRSRVSWLSSASFNRTARWDRSTWSGLSTRFTASTPRL